MTTINSEIKSRAKFNGVFYYEVADKLGIADSAFSRKLRRKLSADEKQRIFSIIDKIAADKQKGVAE